MARNLKDDATEALSRWRSTKNIGVEKLDKHIIVLAATEIEAHLERYIKLHEETQRNNKLIEDRRKDHWDIVQEKCSNNPVFKDLWDELLTLLKLEE